ncbi:respiratory nitrate reductase subunit gamma [Paracoccus fistulariae]|uniref:Respiratory nitrate reductase subunit gamma n=1 Tax=Paracoccus fistulariae TaxID=658446 RepID=A0ABY7SLH5_9RHOB|nr:respiratory nitrate reductase subunit gamma [Paracoccus fistulariae]MDB6181313.1 respiratory nitrate reductase subunit gamma [Paracoccus fistulariae]WCR07362.1 respiratory nitrate reductase subunit gamma [Paracoccus fistulariae]
MEFFIFQVLPYVALTVMFLGSIIRYERDPFTWKSKSSQLLARRQLVIGSVLFHVGIIIIFFGHLVGMLTPIQVFDFLHIGHGFKQVMAIVIGGIAGLMAIAGGLILLHRRLFNPRVRAISSFADIAILVLLNVQLLLGLATIIVSMQHLDGEEMVKFMQWANAIMLFRPDAWLSVQDVHWLFKLHILLGLTIFMLVPFTRLVHMASAPIRYLWRPGYQIVRSKRHDPEDSPAPQHPAE